MTIGNFDGVHVGHRELVRRARGLVDGAEGRGRVVALVFDPHPLTALRTAAAPARLSTFSQRERWLREAGADEVVRLVPTPDVLGLEAEGFVDRVVAQHRPSAWVEGADFRFGKARRGDVALLARRGAVDGFVMDVVEPVEVTLADQCVTPASSTLVRWLVSHGRVSDAAAALGRPYEVEGVVVRGDQRGRTIDCPTANLECEHLLPLDGVYAGAGALPDGRRFPAAISVGDKPTFDGRMRVCEAHLVGWRGPVAEGGAEYGWRLRLEFGVFLRDQVKYDGVGPLVEQLGRDIARSRALFGAREPQEALA